MVINTLFPIGYTGKTREGYVYSVIAHAPEARVQDRLIVMIGGYIRSLYADGRWSEEPSKYDCLPPTEIRYLNIYPDGLNKGLWESFPSREQAGSAAFSAAAAVAIPVELPVGFVPSTRPEKANMVQALDSPEYAELRAKYGLDEQLSGIREDYVHKH